MQSHEILIEAASYLLEAVIDRVIRANNRLSHNRGKHTVRRVRRDKCRQRFLHERDPNGTRHRFPWSVPIEHRRPMQLDAGGIRRVDTCRESVELFGQPMCLPFEERNTRKNEILLAGVLNGTRLVKV